MKIRSAYQRGGWLRYFLALAVVITGTGLMLAGGAKPAKAVGSGTISFASPSSTIVEGQNANIVVNRTGSTSGSISADYTISFTAPATSADLNGLTGPSAVDFANGVSSRTLPGLANGPLTTNDDATNQGSRVITFTLTQGNDGALLGAQTTHQLTITDNDGPSTYAYASSGTTAAESAGTFNVAVVRNGATSSPASVTCTITGGTAVQSPGANFDFSVTDAVANFAVGATTANCQLSIVNDSSTEADETITMGFASPSGFGGGGVAPQTTTVTIDDNDGTGTIQFSNATYTVAEGVGVANISVTRTNGSTGAAEVDCSTVAGGSALAGSDYTTNSDELHWDAGESGSKTCTVVITNDSILEGTETVFLALSGVLGATLGSQATATLNITDNDGSGTISFSASAYSVNEASTTVTISVIRSGDSSGGVSVNFATSNGTASSGSDYLSNSGTLSWNSGESGSRTFSVTILDDALIEGAETVNLTLSGVSGGATLTSPSTAVLTIGDNESQLPTVIGLSPTAGPILGGNTVTITGTNFVNVTGVTFGTAAASNVQVINVNTITVTAPVSSTLAGQTVNVVVTTTAGSSSTVGTGDNYTYTAGPTVTAVTPNTGPTTGTTFVTITGTNFTPSGMTVTFGGTQAIFTYVNATTISAVSPAHSAGTFDVIVTTAAGSSPNTVLDDFTYTGSSAPIVTGVSPSSGPVGTVVAVTGSGFTGTTLVTVGGVTATFTVNNDGSLTVTIPASTPGGTVDIRVTTSGGTSANVTADNFTNTSSSGATTTYVLYFRWTLIAWTGIDNLSVFNAVRGIETGTANASTNDVSGQVTAIWFWDGASQSYKGYFVGFENVPGANDFTTMRRGISYWVAVQGPGSTNWTVLLGN